MPKNKKRSPKKQETEIREKIPEKETVVLEEPNETAEPEETIEVSAAVEEENLPPVSEPEPETADSEEESAPEEEPAPEEETVPEEEAVPAEEAEPEEAGVLAAAAEHEDAEKPLPAKRNGHGFWKAAAGKILRSNPVLTKVLAVCTVLGATTTLKNGLLLTAAAVAVGLPLFVLMFFVCKKLKPRYSYPAALVLSGMLAVPVCMAAGRYFPEVSKSAGFYLPLTALNAVLLLDLRPSKGKGAFPRALAAAAGDLIGYGAVLILLSLIREAVGAGALYGRMLPVSLKFNFLLLPPGAFLTFGLLFALWQGIVSRTPGHKKDGGEAK